MRGLSAVAVAVFVSACGARSELSDVGAGTHGAGDASVDVAVCSAPQPAVIATTTVAVAPGEVVPTTYLNLVSGPHIDGAFVYWVQLADSSVRDYWTDNAPEHIATVNRVAVTGGAIQAVATFNARSDRSAIEVAYDDQHMYWAQDPVGGPGETNGAIMRALLDGSDVTTIVGGLFMPNGVAVVGGKVYFAVHSVASVDAPPTLHRANVDGSSLEVVTTAGPLPVPDFYPGYFAWTADYVYEAFNGVSRLPTTGGVTSVIVSPNWDAGELFGIGLNGISYDGTTGLALEVNLRIPNDPGEIVRWSASGGTFVSVASGFALTNAVPWRTATDEIDAYATSNGAIVRAPLSGGPLQTVGPTINTGGIAFDAAHVYWTSYDTTTVSVWAACK